MIANNKNKFSITSFPFSFNGCYDKFGTIKWFDFCLSMTLRVNFKWLIKRGDGL